MADIATSDTPLHTQPIRRLSLWGVGGTCFVCTCHLLVGLIDWLPCLLATLAVVGLLRFLSIPPRHVVLALLIPVVVALSSLLAYRGVAAYVYGQDRWIKKTKRYLAEVRRRGVTDFVSATSCYPYCPNPLLQPFRTYPAYAFALNEGAVRVGDAGWVYIKCHSSYKDGRHSLPSIGQVSLAIDHTGTLYACHGHVCGVLVLRARNRKGFADIDEFIGSPGHAAGGRVWQLLE